MHFHLLYPSGNPTALVEIRPVDFAQKKDIESTILTKYPEIEQVGFIYTTDGIPMLEMVNEELCVNAIFSYFCVLGKDVPVGFKQEIHLVGPNYGIIGRKIENSYFTIDIPTIYEHQVSLFDDHSVVDLGGISHILSWLPAGDFIKFMDSQILELKTTCHSSVTGINRLSFRQDEIYLEPYIYYHKNKVVIAETSCGSGTISFVASEIIKNNILQETTWKIRQVSGGELDVAGNLGEDGIHCRISNEVLYKALFSL